MSEEYGLARARTSQEGRPPVENRGGMLFFGGVSASELLEKYGSPLYVYDERRIRDNYSRILNAFRRHEPDFGLHYAIKANNNLAIMRILEREGSSVDASSPAEIYLARKAGFGDDRILYSGNYHTDDELRLACESGIRLNLDSTEQMERIIAMDLRPKTVSFRINPLIGSGGHERLIFAGPEVKFGIREQEAGQAYLLARKHGVEGFGIHMMTGSNILDHGYFGLITDRLMGIAKGISEKAGVAFSFIDIGGGLGVPYRPEDQLLDIDAAAEAVSAAFRKGCAASGLRDAKLLMEPGRYIVCDSGVLLARVHSIKRSDKLFVGTDAGMNTLLRPALYGAYHPVLVANRLDETDAEEATIVGQICENTDHLAKDRMLPKVARGDIIALMNAGAYGFAMSSQYNTRPRAAEVLVSGGRHELIRRRESLGDIDRDMVVPQRLK
ncbi:MAG: diaminopimelate decarboxylase [Candidatus Micrarchaeia archaeon]